MLVENASVPFDGRVWKESLTLRDAGFEVAVISPRGPSYDRGPYEELDGIRIHRFSGAVRNGYLAEYLVAFREIRRLVRRVEGQVDVIHAANPPDFLLFTALAERRAGARFVFDQHDLSPELYLSRFRRRRDPLYAGTIALERMAYGAADVVIVTNESYREIAIRRGKKRPDDVFIVRNGPNLTSFTPADADVSLRRGKPHLLVWAGLMSPQDGVDYALRALSELRRLRDDWHALFVGDGDVRSDLEHLTERLGLADAVEFTGHLPRDGVRTAISTADVCLSPDPKTALNDVSTMVKVIEYMALARPIVSFDLLETKRSAGDAAVYARRNSEAEFASLISDLLSSPERRAAMGAIGRARVENGLDWDTSRQGLLAAYARLFDVKPPKR